MEKAEDRAKNAFVLDILLYLREFSNQNLPLTTETNAPWERKMIQ